MRRRLIRFALTGVGSGCLQLILLAVMLDRGLTAAVANAGAFAIAAQVNFALSYRYTWSERRDPAHRGVLTRWAKFLGTSSGTAALNLGVFAGARLVLPDMAAAAIGIAVAAVVNFLLADQMVFQPSAAPSSATVSSRKGQSEGGRASSRRTR